MLWSAFTTPTPVPGSPVALTVHGRAEAIFTVCCALPALVAIILSLRSLVRRADPIPLFCLIGGTLGAFLVEPLLDSNGGVWWPRGGWTAYTLAHTPEPWLVIAVYPWLLGGQAYLSYRVCRQQSPRFRMWQLVGLFALSDIIIETIGLLIGTYHYYGRQSLDLWGLPLWYVPLNAVGPFVAGSLFAILRPHFGGLRTLALLPIFPMSFALVYFGAGFPMWTSLQSSWPLLPSTVAGLSVWGMAVLLAYVFQLPHGGLVAGEALTVAEPSHAASRDRETASQYQR